MNLYNLTRPTYKGMAVYSRDEPPSIRPTPSIHPSGLLQWQAGEFDREAEKNVEAERPGLCARYPDDCSWRARYT